jgi:rubrerythrin
MYVKFAKEAKEEGYISISKLFESVAKIEKMHQERYIKLHNELTKNTTFKSNKEEKWFCSNCGAIINSKDAPKKCPVCSHDQGYFIKSDTKIID